MILSGVFPIKKYLRLASWLEHSIDHTNTIAAMFRSNTTYLRITFCPCCWAIVGTSPSTFYPASVMHSQQAHKSATQLRVLKLVQVRDSLCTIFLNCGELEKEAFTCGWGGGRFDKSSGVISPAGKIVLGTSMAGSQE